MASVAIRKRFRSGSGGFAADPAYANCRTLSFTTTRAPWGMTFDGDFLWLSTEGITGKPPMLVQVNPVTGTMEQEFNLLVGNGHILLDLVTDRRGHFWMLDQAGIGGAIYLKQLDKQGDGRILAGPLASTTRALTFDGERLYVVSAGGFKTVVGEYDLAGNLIQTYSDFNPASANGPGVTFLGNREFVFRFDSTLGGTRAFYERRVPFLGGSFERVVFKDAAAAGDRNTLTFDGYYVYEMTVT